MSYCKWEKVQSRHGPPYTVDTTKSRDGLSGVLSSLSCSHPDIMSSDSVTFRYNKEALKACLLSKEQGCGSDMFQCLCHFIGLCLGGKPPRRHHERRDKDRILYKCYCELGKPSQEASRPTYKREIQLCRPSNLPVLRHLIRL